MKKLTQALFKKFTRVVAEGAGQAIGERAVEAGLITAAQLRDCQEAAHLQPGVPFRKVLEERLNISPQALDVIETLLRQDAGSRRLAGRYEIQEEIGQGAMGIVYRAVDLQLHRPVALKLLRANLAPSSSLVERIKREAHAVARLNHPNIPALYDIGETGGLPYLVMELLEGRNLADEIAEGNLTIRKSVETIQKVAGAVHHAHLNGIVHRDLKPANLQLDKAGEPHILDFGLAHLAENQTALTQSGVAVGTPLYMAPEQANGQVKLISARTDVYALGAILYEMLTGRPPHTGLTVGEMLAKIAESDPEPPRKINAKIPADLETICLKALEKSQERRYATAGDLGADLKRFLEGEAVLARPASGIERIRRRLGRHAWPLAIGSAAVVALITVAILASTVAKQNQEDDKTREELRLAEHAGKISGAYFDLTAGTLEALRHLEDHWLGETPGADVSKWLAKVEQSVRAIEIKYPTSRLPQAWRGLGLFLAGFPDEGSRELDAACAQSAEDPFPHLIQARLHLFIFGRDAVLPGVIFGGPETSHVRFVETELMASSRTAAIQSLDRAIKIPIWGRLKHGKEALLFAEGALALANREFSKAAERLGQAAVDPLFRDQAGWLQGLACYFGQRYDAAVEAWEKLDRWGFSLRSAALACTCQADLEMQRKGDPNPWLDRALADADRALQKNGADAEAFVYRGLAQFRKAELETAAGLDPRPGLARAIESFTNALRHEGHPITFLSRGSAYLELAKANHRRHEETPANLEKAVVDLGKAEKLDPHLFQAYESHGIALMILGRVDEAVRTFEEGLKNNPESKALKELLDEAREASKERK